MTSTNEELLEEENALIFPNPATDQFLIKSEGEEITDLSIFNYLGQQVQREIILDHEKVINISGLDKGIYLIEINKKRRKGFRKLIVL